MKCPNQQTPGKGTITGQAFSRAGLLGNPSDGYSGKTISIIVRNFSARVEITPAKQLSIEAPLVGDRQFANVADLAEKVGLHGYYGVTRLLKGTIKALHDYCRKNNIDLDDRGFSIAACSTIPRQIGLAGSSAIITAALRALLAFFRIEIPLGDQPALILAVEKEELKIQGGLQDRVIQVYQGCVYMDFSPEEMVKAGHGHHENLDPVLLPNLYLAYREELGKVSGEVLMDMRVAYDQGDKLVHQTLAEIATLAATGREALLAGDKVEFAKLIDRNFDLRARIMPITQRNRELVSTARGCGATAKYAGSGGAIIGTYADDDEFAQLTRAMAKIDAKIIKPQINVE